MKKRIVSGVKPTGSLHIGNYIGAIRQWVDMTKNEDAEFLFFVADLHAITVAHDPAGFAAKTREIAAAYIACGLDTEKVTLFVQSAVPDHATMQWLLSSGTSLGWLNRMTQFKDKAGKHKEAASLALYAYPVLQAADVLIYQATHVPVGEDQKQHIELARDIAGSFNHTYGQDFFTLPEPIMTGEGARVMSLRDGTKKMSKDAESDMTRINLTDDADTISQKIRKARTDEHPVPDTIEGIDQRPEARNLMTIYATLSDQTLPDVIIEFGGKNFSDFKAALANLCVEKMGPITRKMNDLMAAPDEIDRILGSGAQRARTLAHPVLEETMKLMGFWGYR